MAHNTADCRSIIVFTFDGRNTAFGAITFTLMPLLVYQASSDLTAGQRRTKISREKIKENREAKAKRKSAFLKQMKTAHMRRMSAPAMQTVPLPASPLPDLPASERPTRKRVKRDIFSPSELSVAPLASAEQPEAPIAPEVPMTQVPEAPAVKSHHAELDLGKSFVDDAVFLSGVEDVMNTRCCDEKVMKVSRDVQRGVGGGHVEFTCGGCGWCGCANRSARLPRGKGKNGKLKPGPLPEGNTISSVHAAIGAGMGEARLNHFLLGVGHKPLPTGTFYKSAGKVEEAHSGLLAKEIKKNLENEIKMTLLMLGDEALDENGNVKIRIITDASWQKRYGRNSLFGYGVMYGFYTGKVVFVSHRCCRCMTCIRSNADGKEAREHKCTNNWNSSAASSNMEREIAVEGAEALLAAGAAISVIVCDGDTKAKVAIEERVPELKGKIEIWNDLNHIGINFGRHLYEIPNLSQKQANKLKKSFNRAVKQTRQAETLVPESQRRGNAERVKVMQKAVIAAIDHYFNKHEGCSEKWCKAKSGKDKNYVPLSLGGYIPMTVYESVMEVVEMYTHPSIIEKLLEESSSNTCEAGNSLLWCTYLPKDKLRMRLGMTAIKRAMLARSMGAGATANAIDGLLGLSQNEKTQKRRVELDARSRKKAAFLQTKEGKIWQGKRKNNRNREIVAPENDKGHNKKENHLNQDIGKKAGQCCSTCGRAKVEICPGGKACPYIADKKPTAPNPTIAVEEGTRFITFDLEYQFEKVNLTDEHKSRQVLEIGAVSSTCNKTCNKRKWTNHKGEYERQVKVSRISTNTLKYTGKGLQEACRENGVGMKEAFDGFVTYAKSEDGKAVVLKAHNGIAADMHFLVEAAKAAGVEDPLQELEAAGVLGIVDPARIIPKYKLISMMNKTQSKKGKEKLHYMKNEELYCLQTGHLSMEAGGLTAHRALDDAKAEREWLKLPVLTKTLFDSSKPCAVSMAALKAYFAQYEKFRKMRKECGTYGKD